MKDWPIYEDPPKRRGVFGRVDPIADWLDDVRGACGEWLLYPRPVAKGAARAIYAGKHEAGFGEFQARIERGKVVRGQQQYLLYARLAPATERRGFRFWRKDRSKAPSLPGGSERTVTDRNYGTVTEAQLNAYNRFGVSPEDHDGLLDEFDGDTSAMLAAVARRSRGGRYVAPSRITDEPPF